jgi:flagellar biosynthesis/type III secretory pathway chaperone
MNTAVTVLKLKELMQEEINLLIEYSQAEDSFRNSIYTRSWEQLEKYLEQMKPVSDKLNPVEKDRNREFHKLQTELGVDKGAGFYQTVSMLDDDLREELTGLYRQLKTAVIKVQNINYAIDTHVRIMKETTGKVLEELYPSRKSKIYMKNGKSSSMETMPLVVNRYT